MKQIKYIFPFLILLGFTYQSCKQTVETDEASEVEEELIFVTNEQFQGEGMLLGEIKEMQFSEDISTNGMVWK